MKVWLYLLSATVFLSACSVANSNESQSSKDPNFKDGIYVNNHIDHPDKSFFTFLKMRFFGDEEWANHEQDAHLIPKIQLSRQNLSATNNQVSWLGHSTFLVRLNGLNILTDPVFSERASPVSFAGPKRYTQVALPMKDLPKIDVVVISHNHYDHLDKESIKGIGDQAKYFVPSGLKSWFMELGIADEQVVELMWWQSFKFGELQLTAMPSQHWSARGLGDRHQSHWASWLITQKKSSIWFAGDTGYNDKDFVNIGQYLKQQALNLDLALIPIGAYGPRHFMKTYHVDTEEAVQIHKDIGSKLSIGMHWGAFPLTSESPMEPYEWLNRLRTENKLGQYPFKTLKIGETMTLIDSNKLLTAQKTE